MIANQLSVLLAQRQLTIKQVVEDLHISRSAISNIMNNPSANIATETIDKLCNYLEVEPKDFFVYAPYSISLSEDFDSKYNPYIIIAVKHSRKEQIYSYELFSKTNEPEEIERQREEKYDLYLTAEEGTYPDSFLKVYKTFPAIFQTQITNGLIVSIENILKKHENELLIDTYTNRARETQTFKKFLEPFGKTSLKTSLQFPWADLDKSFDPIKCSFK